MTRRRCLEDGCLALTTTARCAVHTQPHRGYGRQHQLARAALRTTLPALCGYRCGTLLQPNGDWVAAHRVDGHPEYGWLASCRSCNERAKQGSGAPRTWEGRRRT